MGKKRGKGSAGLNSITAGSPCRRAQQPRGVPHARSYLRGLLGAGGDGGAGALRQRAEAAGRAREALLAQLPHGVLRRRLSGSKAGGAEPRPGRRQSPPLQGRAPRFSGGPSPSAGSAGRRSPPRAPPPPSWCRQLRQGGAMLGRSRGGAAEHAGRCSPAVLSLSGGCSRKPTLKVERLLFFSSFLHVLTQQTCNSEF